MSEGMLERPDVSEYAPYYERYVSLVSEDHVVEALEHQLERTLDFLRACPEQDGDRRYAPGKWSVREVIGHVIDVERVMAFRALSFARGDPATLPGMELDDWGRFSPYGALPLSALMEEFSAVRLSTIALFRHLGPEAWSRRGIASGYEFTVKALAYIIAGHERHHMEILKTRYFAEAQGGNPVPVEVKPPPAVHRNHAKARKDSLMQETPEQYTERILSYLHGRSPVTILASSPKRLTRLLKGVPAKKMQVRPAPERWSVAEILAHIADTELVFGFRLRLTLGASGTIIQAFDQDAWADYARYAKQDPKVSLQAYRILRERNLRLLKSIPKEMWERYGMHTERGKETVTRLSEMVAGHDINHLAQIEGILRLQKRRTK